MSDTNRVDPDTAKASTSGALEIFGAADTTPDLRRAALTELIGAKVLPKRADDPAVSRGRAHLIEQALSATDPGARLLAIAESVRLGQVVKRWMDGLAVQLAPAFEFELASMQLLGEADDRLNLARACAVMAVPWMPAYLARSISEEETGEKARAEMLSTLLSRAATLADSFSKLGVAFERLRPSTEVPGDTAARRLTRTLNALRAAIFESELEAGEGLGNALHRLISATLAATGRPQDLKVKVELSREVLMTVHDIVRTRVSVVADPEMYRSVAYVRKLCGGPTWPDELKRPLDRLVTDITEALVLLGRQGRRDQDLLGQLDILCNHPERARVVARDLAARHPELDEDVRDWLEHGRLRSTRPASAGAIEQAVAGADESIGLALHAARQARQLRDNLTEPLLSTLAIYEPMLHDAAKDLLSRVQVLAVQVEQTAALRALDLYGKPEEEVEFSSKFFTIVGNSPRLRMNVKQPAVVRKRPDGTLGDVVTKGIVE